MSPHKKTTPDPLLAKWLQEFKSPSTRRVYHTALRNFKKTIGMEDFDKYVNDFPDVVADVRKFLASLEARPSKTISTYTGAVKVFLQDNNVKVPEEAWKKIRRRGYMPKRVRAETRDRKPTKTMLKKILNYADIKARALILFLLSSGARIGETLQLQKEDFDLEADPPRVHIKREYTKGGVGERTVFFSYEARDAIQDWLRIKGNMGKRDGTTYEDTKVFSFSHNTAKLMWDLACDKAGLGVKDKRTGRRIYHLHSLRKFFRTKIGLDIDVTHALMGHAQYLDAAYVRLDQDKEIADAYVEAMPNVSVYQVETPEIKTLEEENLELKSRMAKMELELTNLKGTLQKLVDLTENTKKLVA